jgi:methylenetetrahydrofolate reductase (NADPH)
MHTILTMLYTIGDDAAVKRYGVELATEMCKTLLGSGLVKGLHFYTLNLEQAVRAILKNLKLDGERYSTAYTVRTILIHNRHHAHTLQTLYSYTTHIHYTHYTHTLQTEGVTLADERRGEAG